MGSVSWALPVGCLIGVSAIAFFFFFWWFPRTWRKGNAQEMELAAAQKAEQDRLRRQREEADLEGGEGGVDVAPPYATEMPAKPPNTLQYTPPAYYN